MLIAIGLIVIGDHDVRDGLDLCQVEGLVEGAFWRWGCLVEPEAKCSGPVFRRMEQAPHLPGASRCTPKTPPSAAVA